MPGSRRHVHHLLLGVRHLAIVLRHGGFGCAIRSVPCFRQHFGLRLAFARSTFFQDRNNILLRVGSGGNREDVRRSLVAPSQGLLGCAFSTLHVIFENKVIKRCSSSIYRVSGGWDASVLSFYSSFLWRKKLPKSHF